MKKMLIIVVATVIQNTMLFCMEDNPNASLLAAFFQNKNTQQLNKTFYSIADNLLAMNANLNYTFTVDDNPQKYTPLTYLLKYKGLPNTESDSSILKYLIENKADVNLCNSFGETPFSIACQYGNNVDVVKQLVAAGANVSCNSTITKNIIGSADQLTIDYFLELQKKQRIAAEK